MLAKHLMINVSDLIMILSENDHTIQIIFEEEN